MTYWLVISCEYFLVLILSKPTQDKTGQGSTSYGKYVINWKERGGGGGVITKKEGGGQGERESEREEGSMIGSLREIDK